MSNHKRFNAACEMFLTAKTMRKEASVQYEAAKNTVIDLLDGQECVESARFRAEFANCPKQMLDIERLKTEMPNIYLAFLKPQDCWTLTVKER